MFYPLAYCRANFKKPKPQKFLANRGFIMKLPYLLEETFFIFFYLSEMLKNQGSFKWLFFFRVGFFLYLVQKFEEEKIINFIKDGRMLKKNDESWSVTKFWYLFPICLVLLQSSCHILFLKVFISVLTGLLSSKQSLKHNCQNLFVI